MPGYAIAPNTSKPTLIVSPNTVDELYENTFYGIMYDPESGKVDLEVIQEGESIKIPESTTYKVEEYAHWFASSKQINLTWDQSKGTHLLMEVI